MEPIGNRGAGTLSDRVVSESTEEETFSPGGGEEEDEEGTFNECSDATPLRLVNCVR